MADRIVKLNPIRKFIADKLRHSVTTNPHASHFCHVDATKMLELKKKLAEQGEKVTITAIVTAALAQVLTEMPDLNSSINGDVVTYYEHVNPALAMNSPRGLYVLTVKNAEELGVVGISHAMADLRTRLLENKITVDDMKGSSVTLTSLGKCRTNFCTSILNDDQCLIIGVGMTQKEAVVEEDGSIVAKDMMWLIINYNHSITDGTPISNFCDRFCEVVENPEEFIKL